MAVRIRDRLPMAPAAGNLGGKPGLKRERNWAIERNLLARMVFQRTWLRS
jgi:hypothetical protein